MKKVFPELKRAAAESSLFSKVFAALSSSLTASSFLPVAEKDNQEQQNNQNQQSEQPEQSQEQESERQPMTPEEAQRILDAIEDEEKKAFSLRREKMRSDMRRGDDW